MILQTTSFIGASLAASAVTSKHGCLHCAVDRTPEILMAMLAIVFVTLAAGITLAVVCDIRSKRNGIR